MNMLQVSDLFKKRGREFTWEDRIKDQNELKKRINEIQDPDLSELALDLDEFTNVGIASMTFLEYFLEKVTKVCSQKNISMS